MNIIFLTGGVYSNYATDYASFLASTLRAEGHVVKVFIRKKDPRAEVYSDMQPITIGNGGPLDVLSPVKLSGVLRELSGPTIIHVFTTKDARLALNSARLSGRQQEIKTVLAFLNASLLPKFKECERRTINMVSAVTKDTPEPVEDIESAIYVAPGIPDIHLEKTPQTDGITRLLYIGQLTKGCRLPELLKNLEDLKDREWTLDVCGTGRGSFIMGPIRRTRSAGIDSRITWHGDDFDPMKRLACADVIVGEDTPYNRLMADCAATAFISAEPAELSTRVFNRTEIDKTALAGRKHYESTGTYDHFYNAIKAVYNES
ncbi:MAG: hypothetical protein K2M19_08355 [Muribaculaceae bacterium]|nr:hypothetical protein [Muribaculaceae bacterium]